jgi:hypothetical protein
MTELKVELEKPVRLVKDEMTKTQSIANDMLK